MSEVSSHTSARFRRWELVWAVIAWLIPVGLSILALVMSVRGVDLQREANDAAKPSVSAGFSKVDGMFVLDGIYVTNKGGSDIAVSIVEVLNISYPFWDPTAPSPCSTDTDGKMTCTPDMPLGVLDYSELIRKQGSHMYMASKTSCEPQAVPVTAGGAPVAFLAITGMPRIEGRNPLFDIDGVLPPELLKFTVKVSFVGDKAPPITKTFTPSARDQEKPDAVAMKADFNAIRQQCGASPGALTKEQAPEVPRGTPFTRYLYVPHDGKPAQVFWLGQGHF